MEKANNSIAKKLCVNLRNNYLKKLVNDTNQWLNCVVHSLNIKINKSLLRKLMYNFVVYSNERPCRKRQRLGMDQVAINLIFT